MNKVFTTGFFNLLILQDSCISLKIKILQMLSSITFQFICIIWQLFHPSLVKKTIQFFWGKIPPQAGHVQIGLGLLSVQFSSVAQSCPTLCNPVNRSTPGLPVHHQAPEFTQTHAHWVCDAIQPSHPLSSPSPPAFNLSQYQGLFKSVSSWHQMAKVLEFRLQHQSFQWIFRTDLL